MNASDYGFNRLESKYDLKDLEANGFGFNPNILDVNGNYGLIYQKNLYRENRLQEGINFHEAKRIAESNFKAFLKKPRLPTSGNGCRYFLPTKQSRII